MRAGDPHRIAPQVINAGALEVLRRSLAAIRGKVQAARDELLMLSLEPIGRLVDRAADGFDARRSLLLAPFNLLHESLARRADKAGLTCLLGPSRTARADRCSKS